MDIKRQPRGSFEPRLENKPTPNPEAPAIAKKPDATINVPDDEPLLPAHASKKQRRFHIWPRRWSTKKKRICTALLLVLLLLLVGGGYYWYQSGKDKPVESAAVVEDKPAPTTEPSRLSGVEVAIDLNKRPVTGVMIENSPDARPQAGLKEAGIVYEAVAEGGITRFLALFQDTQPESIGPVRSARPYYLDWLLPFDAAYAHVGGSPEALAQIRALGVKDLDQFANSGAYQRVSNRFAPHNVYTSSAKLDQLENDKGYTSSTFTSFVRKGEAPAEVLNANTVDLSISSYLYNVHYDYDKAANSYKRSQGGKPHVDEKSGAQLSPKVVIALVMPSGIASDGTHTEYKATGSGTMYVFQDGVVTQGTWNKPDRKAQFTFTDSTGKPLGLNPGQTWISMVSSPSSVTHKP